MGDQVNVDFGAVEELGGNIDNRVQAISSHLDDLASQIKKLEGIWEGSAQAGFQQTKNTWFTSAEDLKQVLARIATAVHTANANYQQTEHANASRWQG